jgi:hypothetical protein
MVAGQNEILLAPTESAYLADCTASSIASFSDVNMGFTNMYALARTSHVNWVLLMVLTALSKSSLEKPLLIFFPLV